MSSTESQAVYFRARRHVRCARQCRLAAFVLCALGINLPAAAMAHCPADWIDIDVLRNGGTVEMFAVNRRAVPITVTLQVRTRYMTADRPTTYTETVLPEATQLFMALQAAREDGSSHFEFDCDWTIGSIHAIHNDDLLYRLPYETGKSYPVLQGFGSPLSHTGPEQYTVDFKMNEGTPVHAARGGVVARIEESNSKGCWHGGCGKYANYIVILHDDWTTGEYYHLQQNGVLVEPGDKVTAGQKIGLSGNTGNSTMPHLHFGVYRAAAFGKFESVPIQFSSIDGIVRAPRRGALYQAVSVHTGPATEATVDAGHGTVN